MFDVLEEANEDSAASIVEERRFEDGQPSKIRLRYQRSKLMKQLSSSSASSPSPQRYSLRTISTQERTPPKEASESVDALADRKSRYVVAASDQREAFDRLSTPRASPSPTAPVVTSSLDDLSNPSFQSTGAKPKLSSPPTPLPHTPPRPSPALSPPPPPTEACQRLVLPERHSENPLFAESEEEDKNQGLDASLLSPPDGDLPSLPPAPPPQTSFESSHSASTPPPSPHPHPSSSPPPHPRPSSSSPFIDEDVPHRDRVRNHSHHTYPHRQKKPASSDVPRHPPCRQNLKNDVIRKSRTRRDPTPRNDDDDDADGYSFDDDHRTTYLEQRSPSSSSPPPSRHRHSFVRNESGANESKKRSPSVDLEAMYPTTARLSAASRFSFDGAGAEDGGGGGDLVDFLWDNRRRGDEGRPFLLPFPGNESVVTQPEQLSSHPQFLNASLHPRHFQSAYPSHPNPRVTATTATAAPSTSAALVPVDAASTLQSLIVENDELKGKIETLKKELKEKDVRMQSLKLDAAMREAESDSRMASRVAEVVDDLCAAQKERDAALTSCLREVERQRDSAAGRRGCGRRAGSVAPRRGRLSGTRRRGGGTKDDGGLDVDDERRERRLLPFYYPGIDDDEDDEDEDDEFDVSTRELTMQFRRRVEEVEAEKRRAEEIVEGEIKAAVDERDRVLGKCRIMREEIERMKRSNQKQSELERRLTATTQERDVAFAKLRILESKIQDADIEKGLLQSLSREKTLVRDISLLESESEDLRSAVQTLQSEKSILAEELGRALEEKESAQKETRRARKESDAMKDNALMLERHVRMLRDKLARRGQSGGGGGGTARLMGVGGGGSVGSDDRRSSFDSLSDRSGSPRDSITSNARVSRATHL